jgi:uncharacterized protein YbaA (DUF1428 family)
MSYIDGMVAAVPTAKGAEYLAHSKQMNAVLKDYGATRIVECWGDDMPDGKLTSFPLAVQRKDDETVVLSWIEWPSKAARNAGWAKAMADPRMSTESNPMPFDGKRLIHGGFDVILDQ